MRLPLVLAALHLRHCSTASPWFTCSYQSGHDVTMQVLSKMSNIIVRDSPTDRDVGRLDFGFKIRDIGMTAFTLERQAVRL